MCSDRSFRGLFVSVALLSFAIFRPSEAVAAPNDGFALSNDAALRGGTAVANGRDAASVWYNPAAAATVERRRLDASISAYGLRHTKVRDALGAEIDTTRRRVDAQETHGFVVPAAVSFGLGFPKKGLGLVLSLHNPVFADIESRTQLRADSGDTDVFEEFNAVSLRRRYHVGATLGWEPHHERFRIGVTVGGVWDKQVTYSRLLVQSSSTQSPAAAVVVRDSDLTTKIGALDLSLGIQGQVSRRVHLGASLRTPSLVVWRKFAGGQTVTATTTEPSGTTTTTTEQTNDLVADPRRFFTPWSVRAGISIDIGQGMLAVDAEASTGHNTGGDAWQRAAVWNVRFGGSGHVSERWEIGAGLFTDRTSSPRDPEFPAVSIHRWGGSFGTRLSTPVKLHRSERVPTLVFETTAAARYAFGIGDTVALDVVVPPDAPHQAQIELDRSTRATQHLLLLQVGTGLRF